MIAEAFESAWLENEGVQPVDHQVLVDIKVYDAHPMYGEMAGEWHWSSDEEFPITHWRIHTPLDTTEHKERQILPEPPRPAPTMPACKPPKSEKVSTKVTTKVGRLRDKDILATFNKLTGCDLSEDHYKTLLSLQEMFDMRDDICF